MRFSDRSYRPEILRFQEKYSYPKGFIYIYYSNKIASLKDIFGTDACILENDCVIVGAKRFPVVNDVINIAKVFKLSGELFETWDNLFRKVEYLLPKRFRQTLYGDKLYKIAGILKSKSPGDVYKGFVSHWKTPENLVLDSNEPETILDNFSIKASIPNFKERMMFLTL